MEEPLAKSGVAQDVFPFRFRMVKPIPEARSSLVCPLKEKRGIARGNCRSRGTGPCHSLSAILLA